MAESFTFHIETSATDGALMVPVEDVVAWMRASSRIYAEQGEAQSAVLMDRLADRWVNVWVDYAARTQL